MPITYLAFERRRPSVLRAHPTRAPESNRSNAAIRSASQLKYYLNFDLKKYVEMLQTAY